MIWLKLAGDVTSWGTWLWLHRQELEPVLAKLSGVGAFGQTLLADPITAVRRVGNTLMFKSSQGDERVLAFIEQTTPRLDQIEQAVSGVQSGMTGIVASLGHLHTMSMVALGMTALTSTVLVCQMAALGRRLRVLEKQIAGLHKKFDAAKFAELETGLDFLRQGQDFLEAGKERAAHDRFTAALGQCIGTMNYFATLLGGELTEKRINQDQVRLLTRHLSVALTAAASCQIGLKHDHHAFSQSRQELELLRQATRLLFAETVDRDPTPFLLPAMREHGVTIEVMTELYQQAQAAGAHELAMASSPAAWFEQHREGIFRTKAPWTGRKAFYQRLKTQLDATSATVEETNRVIGLSRMVAEVQASGRSMWEVDREITQNTKGLDPEATAFSVWTMQ